MKMLVKMLGVISFLSSISIISMEQPISRKFIVITDLEPDDRIALHIMAARIPEKELLFVGTTVMNAARKQVLTRRLLDQLNLKNVPVYQGSGGTASSYEDLASSQAARCYSYEGSGILDKKLLEKLNLASHSNSELQNHIEQALESNNDLEFIILAPPTDLVHILNKRPELTKNIKHIYLMGGWSEIQESEDTILRTTYNWNMDPICSAQLMSIKDIPMTIYSSHSIKRSFNGGSINFGNFPKIIAKIEKYKTRLPSLVDQEIASLSWDNHILETIPALRNIIYPYKGKQFTPADPLIIIGIINNDLIEESRQVNIDINIKDKNYKGFRINVTSAQDSNIKLIEKINTNIFEKELLKSLKYLIKSVHS